MKISIIATSQTDLQADKHEFDVFGGKAAGVCYMASTFQEIMMEDSAKTMRRVNQTKDSGHHSVYDHSSLSLYIDGLPKILAMILVLSRYLFKLNSKPGVSLCHKFYVN